MFAVGQKRTKAVQLSPGLGRPLTEDVSDRLSIGDDRISHEPDACHRSFSCVCVAGAASIGDDYGKVA